MQKNYNPYARNHVENYFFVGILAVVNVKNAVMWYFTKHVKTNVMKFLYVGIGKYVSLNIAFYY